MHVNLWLTGRMNGFEMAWALCASLIFHVLLILILASSAVYYPATGTETRFDVIWAPPSALPRNLAATAEVKPLRNPPGLHQKTAASEAQLLQDGPPQDSLPQSTGAAAIADQPPGEVFQDLDVFMVLAKAPTRFEAAPAAVKTVAISRRVPNKKREPASVRDRQESPLTAGITSEEPPSPAPSLAFPAKNDTRLLTELQDESEPTPQRKPVRLNIPKAKKEPDLLAAEGNVVAQVQIPRNGGYGVHQSAPVTDLTAMAPEMKGGQSSSDQEVLPPEGKVPAPFTAQKERIKTSERENPDWLKAEGEKIYRQVRLVHEQEEEKRQAARLRAEGETKERERVALIARLVQEHQAAHLRSERDKKERERDTLTARLAQEQLAQEQHAASLKAEGVKRERERIVRVAQLAQEQQEPKRKLAQLSGQEVSRLQPTIKRPEQLPTKRVPGEAKSKRLALARQEDATAKSPGDKTLPAQQLARTGKRAAIVTKVSEPPRPSTEQNSLIRQRASAGMLAPSSVARQGAHPAPTTSASSPAARPAAGGDPQPSGKHEHRDVAFTQSALNSQSAPKPAEKPLQTRGLVLAALHGDLKLVMTGDTGIKVTVKFRNYPKSRRNRVLTRSEVRGEQTVVPLLAAPREDTREAVVQTAGEGIYLFSAEPAGGHSVRVNFTLQVFESGARERTVALGNRSLSGPTVLLKILMPEAILWEDESAFTGSMEDSESETKFNATTGLYWKEFRD